MRSIFYLLDTAPYGSEKAFGALNAAAVSLNRMHVILGLYGDGVYLGCRGAGFIPVKKTSRREL